MPFANFELAIALLAAFASASVALRQAIWNTYIRTEHLRVAIIASNDFYDRAEILLKDPGTPEILRNMIFDIGLAVTNEKAGRKATFLIMESLADIRHRGRVTRPRKEFLDLLNDLRRSRGDLYDAFHEALGAAFTAILSAHTSKWNRSKVALNYDASGGNRSKTLSLAESLDAAFSDRRNGGKSGHQPACA